MVDIPIRLHERGGRVIALDCIDFFITVKRQVPVISIPLNAQRWGLDPNRVTTSVRLNCLLRDDDCAAAELVKQPATAFLDFSRSRSGGGDYMVGNAAQDVPALASLDGATIQIMNATGVTYTVTFDITASNPPSASSGTAITVGLNGAEDPPEGHEIASRLKAALETNSSFTGDFTITLAEGAKVDILPTGEELTKIKFTQKSAGASGNNDTPVMTYSVDTLKKPDRQSFIGGSINNCRSAGDKAQDLLASVINSQFLGVSGALTRFADVWEPLTDQFESDPDRIGRSLVHDDYVMGLQIPYNSLLHAALGSTNQPIQGYEPRNFMMVTGWVPTSEQDASGNLNAASVAFNANDTHTGIHGCLTDCDIRYNAGETIYEAVLTFQPVDWLFGI